MINQNVKFKDKLANFIVIFVLALLALSCIFPLWHVIVISFSNRAATDANLVKLWPIGFNLEAYKLVMEDQQFITSFITSLKRVFFGVIVSMLLILLTAYPLSLNSKKFKGREVFMWIAVFPMIFSGGLVPLYFIISKVHLIDSFWVLVLPTAFITFNVIVLMNFFRMLPEAMSESAHIDGAGHLTILFKIYIPNALPSIATLVLFTVVNQWNDWFYGLIFINTPQKFPLQTYLYFMTANIDYNRMTPEEINRLLSISGRSLRAARILIAIIPIVVVYPFLQNYFVAGLTIGSVKE